MTSIEQETITRSFQIVHERVQVLVKTWSTYFNDKCYQQYMTSLPTCIGMFLDEIFGITIAYCAMKSRQIRDLQAEVDELRCVLGVKAINDWESQHMPLDRKSALLQQLVMSLREQINHRRRQVDEYVKELTTLCDELAKKQPNFKPLYTSVEGGPLPDEKKMTLFGDYLESLREEKAMLAARIDQLQEGVQKLAKQLGWVPRKAEQRALMNQQNLAPTAQNITDLEYLFGVLHKLLRGKQTLQQKQQEQLLCLGNNPSPPPPPPSPEVEPAAMAPFSQAPRIKQASQSLLVNALCNGRLFNIHDYRQMLAESDPILSHDLVAQGIIRSLQLSISLWWDRCLISNEERGQYQMLHMHEGDCIAVMGAHVDQQERLKTYYLENESIFKLIRQWSDSWRKCLKFQSHPGGSIGGGQVGTRRKKKTSTTTAEKELMAKAHLSAVEAELKDKCAEFERRNKVKFTIFGLPAIDVLNTFKVKCEEMKLPKVAAVDPSVIPVLNECDKSVPGITPCNTIGLVPSLNRDLREESLRMATALPVDAEAGSGSISSDGEANQRRDDELLEEAFASASAVSKKSRTRSVNGARLKSSQAKSNANQSRLVSRSKIKNEVPAVPTQTKEPSTHPMSTGKATEKAHTNCEKESVVVPEEKGKGIPPSSAGSAYSADASIQANATAVASKMECVGVSKVQSKSKHKRSMIF